MKIFQDLNGKCHLLTQMYTNFKGVAVEGGLFPDLHVTPLESPLLAPCEAELLSGLAAGMKMRFLLERTRGLKLHVSPPVGRSNTF